MYDISLNDSDAFVRCIVAEQGYQQMNNEDVKTTMNIYTHIDMQDKINTAFAIMQT